MAVSELVDMWVDGWVCAGLMSGSELVDMWVDGWI